MQPVLIVEALSKRYGGKEVVADVHLQVDAGQVFGVLGPNGSGKTTTLAMLLGVVRPSGGQFTWFGERPSAKNRRRVGSLLEKPIFSPWLSAHSNLSIVAAIRGISQPGQAIGEVLEQFRLQSVARQPIHGYSLGMKQRLALAAAFLGKPEVLVLDEPTNGIDAEGIADIRHILRQLAGEGRTIILASHILDEVEKLCSHTAVFKQGRVIGCGAITDVLAPDPMIELASDDMELLARVLGEVQQALPQIKGITRQGGHWQVTLNEELKPAQLHKELLAHGVVLSHLSQRTRSLEAHFLDLLERT